MSTSAAGTTCFKLRTPAHIKSCHITGSWDKYTKRYQMSADTTAGAGWWTLTLRFGSSIPAGRYWYYYILDGYFESHDPNKPSVLESKRNITLNILDHAVPSPSSSASSSPRSVSSRFPSPTSSTSSHSSKRSGGVYGSSPNGTISRQSSGYPSNTRRTPSPRRQQAELSHLVHPKPRNPMGQHKLTLDTHSYYSGRPHSMITTAATTAGDSSPGSSRSGSSIGSWCSSCDGNGYSPSTPNCTCASPEFDEYDSCSDIEDDGIEVVYVDERRKSHHPGYPSKRYADDELAYRLERGLRM
jgi:hypothetical protein